MVSVHKGLKLGAAVGVGKGGGWYMEQTNGEYTWNTAKGHATPLCLLKMAATLSDLSKCKDVMIRKPKSWILIASVSHNYRVKMQKENFIRQCLI